AEIALETHPRKETQHAVAAPEVPAADLEEAPRGELELLVGARHRPSRKETGLETAADTNGRRRRLDYVHDDVPLGFAGPSCGQPDAHSTEDPHVDEPHAGTIDGGGPGRLPRLETKLVEDGQCRHAFVPDDGDVGDSHLRSLVDLDAKGHVAAVLADR